MCISSKYLCMKVLMNSLCSSMGFWNLGEATFVCTTTAPEVAALGAAVSFLREWRPDEAWLPWWFNAVEDIYYISYNK